VEICPPVVSRIGGGGQPPSGCTRYTPTPRPRGLATRKALTPAPKTPGGLGGWQLEPTFKDALNRQIFVEILSTKGSAIEP